MTATALVRVCDHTLYLDGRAMRSRRRLGDEQGRIHQLGRQPHWRHLRRSRTRARALRALPRGDRIEAEQAAVGATPGMQSLCVPAETCASLASAGLACDGARIEVKVLTLEALMRARRIAWIDLLKIDIEGAEIELLEGLERGTFAQIGQMTVEFHDFVRPSDKPRVANVLARLRDNGFHVFNFGQRHFTDVLCLNRAVYDIDLKLHARLMASKYSRGARRMIERWSSNALRSTPYTEAAHN